MKLMLWHSGWNYIPYDIGSILCYSASKLAPCWRAWEGSGRWPKALGPLHACMGQIQRFLASHQPCSSWVTNQKMKESLFLSVKIHFKIYLKGKIRGGEERQRCLPSTDPPPNGLDGWGWYRCRIPKPPGRDQALGPSALLFSQVHQ